MKRFLWIAAAMLCFLSGCSHAEPPEMPEIVLMHYTDRYIAEPDSDTDPCVLTFLDRNGNWYLCTDQAFLSQPLTEQYKAFCSESAPVRQIKTVCTPEELLERYVPVSGLSRTDIQLDMPEIFPAVEADEHIWYILNFDGTQALQAVVIHKNECLTDIQTTNEAANAFYDWFTAALGGQAAS